MQYQALPVQAPGSRIFLPFKGHDRGALAAIDAAITEIMSSTDPVRRQELFTFALTHLHEGAIYIPLTYETNKALFTKRLKGVGFNQTQYEVPFTRMYFEGK